MAFDFDLGVDLYDLALFVDDERRALNAHVFAAVHGFLLPRAVGLGDLVIFIANESEGQFELALEFVVRLHAVGADTKDDSVLSAEGLVGVAELTGFRRAARRIVFGIEIQHDVLAAKILQPNGAVTVGWRGEIWCGVADRRHSGTQSGFLGVSGLTGIVTVLETKSRCAIVNGVSRFSGRDSISVKLIW